MPDSPGPTQADFASCQHQLGEQLGVFAHDHAALEAADNTIRDTRAGQCDVFTTATPHPARPRSADECRGT
jgi:hypothetical protein